MVRSAFLSLNEAHRHAWYLAHVHSAGATFWFEMVFGMPLERAEPTTLAVTPIVPPTYILGTPDLSSDPPSPGLRPEKTSLQILVVDDDPLTCKLMQRVCCMTLMFLLPLFLTADQLWSPYRCSTGRATAVLWLLLARKQCASSKSRRATSSI